MTEKKIFKEIHQFYTFYPKITSPWGGGHEIYNFLFPYPTDVTHQIWLRLAFIVLEKKMLTYNGR